MKQARQLRSLLARPGPIRAPSIYDGLSARAAELNGYDAVFISGAGVEASRVCKPDLGYITLAEMADQAGNIASGIGIPVICDCDIGYGTAINAARTVQEFEKRGVAGIMIEDQALPKRCGVVGGTRAIPMEEMVEKIQAAAEARESQDFLIIGRTEAMQAGGYTEEAVQEALRRARAYLEAGAEMIYFATVRTREHKQILARGMNAPAAHLMSIAGGIPSEGNRVEEATARDLAEWGYKLIVGPRAMPIAIKALMEAMATFRETGTSESVAYLTVSRAEQDRVTRLIEGIRAAVDSEFVPVYARQPLV